MASAGKDKFVYLHTAHRACWRGGKGGRRSEVVCREEGRDEGEWSGVELEVRVKMD